MADQGANDGGIVERQHIAADDLALFMALAGDHEHVAGPEFVQRGRDSLRAVADFAAARATPA